MEENIRSGAIWCRHGGSLRLSSHQVVIKRDLLNQTKSAYNEAEWLVDGYSEANGGRANLLTPNPRHSCIAMRAFTTTRMDTAAPELQDETFKATYKWPKASLDEIRLGYCTPSAGADKSHTLPIKLQAIAAAGFSHVEMGFPDLVTYAQEQLGDSFGGEKDYDSLEQIAKTIHAKCEDLGLYVATLMPFGPYGGYTKESDRKDALERADGWFRIIKALGNPMLQCGTSDEPSSSSDIDVHVKDLQTLADLAATRNPPIRIAYEQWCWGKHFNTWQHSWQIVQKADRPNLGLCLDTFQTSGIDYADPTQASGLNELAKPNPAEYLKASLRELVIVPPEKIFYLQISSASRMIPPLGPSHPAWEDGKPARFLWSDSFRPMPFNASERGTYLPVMPVIEAVLQTGFRGIFSCETFDMEKMKEEGQEVPAQLTGKAALILKNRILAAFTKTEIVVMS